VTLSLNGQYRLQGWVVSAFVHGLALTVALGLMAQVKPVVPKEAFQWDVSLVEPQRNQESRQAEMKPTLEPAKPTLYPDAATPSQPQSVTQDVQAHEVTPFVQREIRQVLETSQPIQQTVPVHTRTEAVTSVGEQQPAEVQQTTQAIVESVAPIVQHEAVTTVIATTAAPVQQTETQPATTEASVHPVEARTIETAAVTRDPDPSSPSEPATPAANDPKLAEPVMRESQPTSATKADYGWLAESLRRRLAEIKRYPSAARLNGWEGKVVLRAVIRADGQLSEVRIHRSSGHEVLDNAAMEAIRLVCPLHMTNEMAVAEVAVYVPMVYSLGG
jgi:protein TonB